MSNEPSPQQSVFTRGIRVRMTQLAVDNGLSKTRKHGVVAREPQSKSPQSIAVRIDGKKSLQYYHPSFWSNAEDPLLSLLSL